MHVFEQLLREKVEADRISQKVFFARQENMEYFAEYTQSVTRRHMEYIRQSRPDSGLGFQAKVLQHWRVTS